MHEFTIRLDSWVIQDGNHKDFKVGKNYNFAIEMDNCDLVPTSKTEKLVKHVENDLYEVEGEIVYSSEKGWIVDFGICTYSTNKPPKWAKEGKGFWGEISLSVDAYDYNVFLKPLKEVPNIIYKFNVLQILLETTPWFEVRENFFARDKEKESYVEITQTNAWDDEQGVASYLLKCALLGKKKSFLSRFRL